MIISRFQLGLRVVYLNFQVLHFLHQYPFGSESIFSPQLGQFVKVVHLLFGRFFLFKHIPVDHRVGLLLHLF